MAPKKGVKMETIVEMRAAGWTYSAISAATGTSVPSICNRLKTHARRTGIDIPAALASPVAISRLGKAAKSRGIPASELVRRILDAVATGGAGGAPIIDAVLDDQP